MPEPGGARFRATVHYDGSAFHGWQLQPEERTVQGAVEAALGRLLAAEARIDAAGRTDAGVHAAGQEVAFDAPERWTPEGLRRGLNAVLDDDVWIERVRRAAAGFHPRFDATGRRYEYLVGTAADAASPLRARRVWAIRDGVEVRTLHELAARLPGERSFGGFAKSGQPERGTRCRVESAGWSRNATGDLVFEIVADRFLHHMVRYLVGTQVEVATGRREAGGFERLLAERPGPRPPRPAPPWGLYLTGVRYGEGWNRRPGVPGAPRRDSGEGTRECEGR